MAQHSRALARGRAADDLHLRRPRPIRRWPALVQDTCRRLVATAETVQDRAVFEHGFAAIHAHRPMDGPHDLALDARRILVQCDELSLSVLAAWAKSPTEDRTVSN